MVEDVDDTMGGLVRADWGVEMSAASPDEGFGAYAYLRSPSGVVFEAVSTVSRDMHAGVVGRR